MQPTGLVVSAPALVRAGAILERSDAAGQNLLRGCVEERRFEGEREPAPWLPDFRGFAERVLGWSFSPKGYAGTAEAPIPEELKVALPQYGETLEPDYAVRELEPAEVAPPWQLLVRVLEPGEGFDRPTRGRGGLEGRAGGRDRMGRAGPGGRAHRRGAQPLPRRPAGPVAAGVPARQSSGAQ